MLTYPHRILFIRHGETDYNREGRLQGQLDIPLNAKGRSQASSIGRTLAKRMGGEIDALEAARAFVASPLSRARETMSLARAGMGLPQDGYTPIEALRELTFGDWEGLTWPQVAARDRKAAEARSADKWNYRPPNGENYADLADRLTAWLVRLSGDLFVCAHGGVARALMALIAGAPESVAEDARIHQGRAIVFEGGKFRWIG